MSWGVVTAMGSLSIQTTRIEESLFDATQVLGLVETGRDGDEVHLAAAGVHRELTYKEGPVDGLQRLGFLARDVDAVTTVRRRVEQAGLRILAEAPEAGAEDGVCFVGPDGIVFEVYAGMAARTIERVGFGPDRYGHINLHPTDVESMREFFEGVLDFRVADVVGERFAYFMRCNADHHGVALIAGHGTLHHHAWQAQSIADLARLGDRLHALGRHLIWGPVRHGAGHNIAAYYVEPTGCVVELYADLEQIYDDERPAVRWDAEDHTWFNRWGTYRGEDFRSHGIAPLPAPIA